MFGFNRRFWLLNLIQIIERLAWSSVILVIAIYVAQKDVTGGLHWGQSVKGLVFFIWAVVQNLTPVFFGSSADRYGRRKVLLISFFLTVVGYLIMGTQREFYPFIFGTVVLGAGLGLFKPPLLGMLANTMDMKKTATGWAIYVMLVNLATFFAPSIAKSLQTISWNAVFIGSASIFSLNFLLVFLLREEKDSCEIAPRIGYVIKQTAGGLIQPRVAWFVAIMSGFIMIYLQFYETLPNFLYDWTDSRSLVAALKLPDWLLMDTTSGKMIDYRWLYSVNSALIVLFVVLVSRIMKRMSFGKVFKIGVLLAASGLFIAGFTYLGIITILGMTVYTFGEMIINPKFSEYMASLTGAGDKSTYLGYMYFSYAVGLGGGSLLGGFLYERMSEKSTLAGRYLSDVLHYSHKLNPSENIQQIMKMKGIGYDETVKLLWNYYNPQQIWYIFMAIGLLTLTGLWMYFRKFRENTV